MTSKTSKSILHYQILDKLGQGPGAATYKAFDTGLQKVVVIKLFGRPGQEPPDFVWRYLPVLEKARRLAHPNIVPLHDVREHDGIILVVMEYIESQTLHQKLDSMPLSLDTCLHLAVQLADGLNYSHRRDLPHGNLKPSNILIGSSDHLVITDFGIPALRPEIGDRIDACSLEQLAYLPPEVLHEQPAGYLGDFHTVGVLIYEMLTGQTPFPGDNHAQLRKAISDGSPDLALLKQLGVPGGVVLLVNQLLSKNKETRCSRFDELLITLRSIDEFEHDNPPDPYPQRRRFSARNYLSVSLLAVLVLILWIVIASQK